MKQGRLVIEIECDLDDPMAVEGALSSAAMSFTAANERRIAGEGGNPWEKEDDPVADYKWGWMVMPPEIRI